jgi:pimeloyl-ACP methyl ester carboxylesterase
MQKSISFKNAKISFSDVGKGTVVVLIHGFLENSSMWNDLVPALSKRNRIITVDLLGHGNSECLGYVHPMELFAETIEAVLKHLKIRTYILVGHSLGGYVSLALTKINPSKVKGLCLVNSTSNGDDEERKKLRVRANKLIQNNFANMVRMSFINLFGEQSRTRFKNEMESALKVALQTPIQGYIAAQEGMRIRPNTTSILEENNFKKLIIMGRKDPVLNVESSLVEAKQTHSEIIIFPNGHMPHIENKADFFAALKSFVKSC